MSWLTSENCLSKTQEAIASLREKVEVGRLPLTGILQYGFSESIGVEFSAADRDTYFISRTNIGNQLAQDNVVCWTHWVGRVSVQVRDFIQRTGRFPDRLEYGPPGLASSRPVGPWVRYQFEDGHLREHTFRQPGDAGSEAVHAGVQEVGGAPLAAFGLRDIVDVRDLEQDEKIRGPMQGVYLLTGGPGVGKTTVALHRIAYLLYEQHKMLPPGVPSAFFEARTIHVVVWKEHLVPYLEKCLGDLSLPMIPVLHIEDWVSRAVRKYVKFGNGVSDYKIAHAEDDVEAVKVGSSTAGGSGWPGLDEKLLQSFLLGRDEQGIPRSSLGRSLQRHSDSLFDEVSTTIRNGGVPFDFNDFRGAFVPSSSGVESLASGLIDRLKREVEREKGQAEIWSTSTEVVKRQAAARHRSHAVTLQAAIELVRRYTARMQEALDRCELPSLLAEFYGSPLVLASLAGKLDSGSIDRFFEDVKTNREAKRLTRADRYFLLWAARILTKGKRAVGGMPAMEEYSHTVVDEAQYYDPLLLRLLIDLAKQPLCSMTIVGDLEQKVTSTGGVMDWDSAGIVIDPDRFFKLTTNYRWTRGVFEFLHRFRVVAGIRESLSAPRTWPRVGGVKPTIARYQTQVEEDAHLVDKVVEARRIDQSIAVVVPPNSDRARWTKVIRSLASYDVRARWADGEDVKECVEQVVITDYESVVGLEFDAVILPSFECVVVPGSSIASADVRKAWVAMTRAKKLLSISHVHDVGLLSDPSFDDYRD